MAQEEIIIRQYEPQIDKAFITSSWLKSYKGESNFAKNIPTPIYFQLHGELVNRILDRQTTRTLVAACKEDTDVIIGYAVFERINSHHVIHYVYVKRAFSGLGICKILLDFAAQRIEYSSHMTVSGKRIAEKMGIEYCPYYIFT